jgi:23S rRNA (cytidine1920-2'-O)/16S rRNA (cytidine1409-2'-O)-methyltransferase
MSRLRRLDAELVRRGLARSRQHAGEVIEAGQVLVSGTKATKAATQVDPAVAIVITGDADPGYASRAAHKLLGALEAFAVQRPGRDALLKVAGRSCLDAGASTGGFTDVLLRNEVERVIAVDVGYGQLIWRLQQDPRVTVLDRHNVRELTPDQLPYVPDLIVGDLSFISLRLVLPALQRCALFGSDFVLMVKPQFEVGRERLGAGGVVRRPEHRIDAVRQVVAAARDLGLGCWDVKASPLPGPSGNVEYFVWFAQAAPDLPDDVIVTAVEEGPR